MVKVTTVELKDHTPTAVSTPATHTLYWVLGESPGPILAESRVVVNEVMTEVKVFW